MTARKTATKNARKQAKRHKAASAHLDKAWAKDLSAKGRPAQKRASSKAAAAYGEYTMATTDHARSRVKQAISLGSAGSVKSAANYLVTAEKHEEKNFRRVVKRAGKSSRKKSPTKRGKK